MQRSMGIREYADLVRRPLSMLHVVLLQSSCQGERGDLRYR